MENNMVHELTPQDIQTLQRIVNTTHQDPDFFAEDPVDLPPVWESQNKIFGWQQSLRIAHYAQLHSNSTAAEHFGISERTVERHRATWNKDSVDKDKIKLAGHVYIDEPMCAVMREMAHDGWTLSSIADKFGCHKRTVHLHVSDKETCQHTHSVPRKHYD